MPTLPSSRPDITVILFGLECITTSIVLQELLRAGVNIEAVCLPGRRSIPFLRSGARPALPMAGGVHSDATVLSIAHHAGIDVWRIGHPGAPEVRQAFDDADADAVLVACYHQLIPAELYANRRFGGLNLHPSLLPDKRGPDPLFWVFANDDREVGTTIHRLSDQFDAGDILAQDSFEKPDGITEDELDAMLARLGATLTLLTLQKLEAGTTTGVRQDERKATWAAHPSPADFHIAEDWSARRAFNFVRGIEGRNHPIMIDFCGARHQIAAIHEWGPDTASPYDVPPGATVVHFDDGWLVATLSEPSEMTGRVEIG